MEYGIIRSTVDSGLWVSAYFLSVLYNCFDVSFKQLHEADKCGETAGALSSDFHSNLLNALQQNLPRHAEGTLLRFLVAFFLTELPLGQNPVAVSLKR